RRRPRRRLRGQRAAARGVRLPYRRRPAEPVRHPPALLRRAARGAGVAGRLRSPANGGAEGSTLAVTPACSGEASASPWTSVRSSSSVVTTRSRAALRGPDAFGCFWSTFSVLIHHPGGRGRGAARWWSPGRVGRRTPAFRRRMTAFRSHRGGGRVH